jgi:DNA-binding IclR family transcriptional regulator
LTWELLLAYSKRRFTNGTAHMSTPAYSAPAVDGALSILETLSSVPQMGVSELAKKLGLSKGSVYRLLATLDRRGYVEKASDSDRYQLTYRLFAVGSRAADRLGLREVAQPVMERLRSETGETVNLGVSDPSVRLQSATVATVQVQITPAPAQRVFRNVPVHLRGLGQRLAGQVLPPTVAVSLRGPRALLDRLHPGALNAVVDLAGLGPGRYNLPVRVEPPQNTEVLQADPASVRVRIR